MGKFTLFPLVSFYLLTTSVFCAVPRTKLVNDFLTGTSVLPSCEYRAQQHWMVAGALAECWETCLLVWALLLATFMILGDIPNFLKVSGFSTVKSG